MTADSANLGWLRERGAGILLHATCFPGPGGIGTLGPEARVFLDFLSEAGMTFWQLCPLGPTGYGDSPYSSFSAFAGNPFLIDHRELVQYGLLEPEETAVLERLAPGHADYAGVFNLKLPLLRKAYHRFLDNRAIENRHGSFEAFRREEASWLEGFTLYRALKDHLGGRHWLEWPAEYRSLEAALQTPLAAELSDAADAEAFQQFLFFRQWAALRAYANERGIQVIGDVPIFVSLDSADVWQHPEYFELGEDLRPLRVAGVPPDYFSETGQLWGNPLYRWDRLAADGYAWWLDRLGINFRLFDVVRIDHFRGFAGYYAIDAAATDAREGTWEAGPGLEFFEAVGRTFSEAPIILEDLGVITDDVVSLREASGLPGMAVLQFAFDDRESEFLPHRLHENSVLYPGTHDNDTTLGWYRTAPESTRDFVRRYLRVSGDEIGWDFIRAGYQSVARLFVVPLQDVMSLGSEARFNTPGRALGNWQWRYRHEDLERLRGDTAGFLRYLGELYGRVR